MTLAPPPTAAVGSTTRMRPTPLLRSTFRRAPRARPVP